MEVCKSTIPGQKRTFWQKVMADPLTHFILAGGILFVGAQWWQARHSQSVIVISQDMQTGLADNYAREFGQRPNNAVMHDLIAHKVEEEALYRDGMTRGVDRDDEIVRRRVVQKMRFLTEDMATTPEPDKKTLQAFYERNRTRYLKPATTTFTHIFFSPDQSSDASALARARHVLGSLDDKLLRAPDRGDAFADQYDYDDLDQANVQRLFGRTSMASAVATAPVGRWVGPFRSAYGWHLVRVDHRSASAPYAFDDVASRVQRDASKQMETLSNQQALDRIVHRYRVVIAGERRHQRP